MRPDPNMELERGKDPIGTVRVRGWPYEVECRKCGNPRKQRLVMRASAGGETWEVLKCC